MKKAKINIEGMTCVKCSGHVEKSLSKLSGTKNINVNPVTGRAFLAVDDSITKDQLAKAVKDAGYTPKEVELESSASSNSQGERKIVKKVIRKKKIVA